MHTIMLARVAVDRHGAGLLCLGAASFCVGVAGFVVSFAASYADGGSNHYTGVWVSGFAMVLAVQAACVVLVPSCSTKGTPGARFRVWACFSAWMGSCGLILLVALGIALPSDSGWAVAWLAAAATIYLAARRHHKAQQQACAARDVEASVVLPADTITPQEQHPEDTIKAHHPTAVVNAEAQQQPAGHTARCSKACWRHACRGCGHCMAWSSLFWAAVIGLFLVIQSASLASDQHLYPPPGVLVSVPILLADGGTRTVQLHIFCKGPSTPGLSTFILEAGGGAPGVTLAGLGDGLAAGGRRVCWYDRLGYGWSDDAIKPSVSNRSADALHKLLAGAPPGMAPPPYIVAGHSAGGQLALQYAASYPDDVAGIALLDSYSDVAIHKHMMLAQGGSMRTHSVLAPNGSLVTLPDAGAYYAATVPVLDLLRAVTPLAWARWITGHNTGPYSAATNALYGNNRNWHAQWVDVLGLVQNGVTIADNLTLSNGAAVWSGAGWPDFSPKPVLLMPTARTLALPASICSAGTDYTLSTQCVATIRAPQQYCASQGGSVGACLASFVYPDLYMAYKDTLSFNSTLFVLPGGHAVWENPAPAVEQLLAMFAGV